MMIILMDFRTNPVHKPKKNKNKNKMKVQKN